MTATTESAEPGQAFLCAVRVLASYTGATAAGITGGPAGRSGRRDTGSCQLCGSRRVFSTKRLAVGAARVSRSLLRRILVRPPRPPLAIAAQAVVRHPAAERRPWNATMEPGGCGQNGYGPKRPHATATSKAMRQYVEQPNELHKGVGVLLDPAEGGFGPARRQGPRPCHRMAERHTAIMNGRRCRGENVVWEGELVVAVRGRTAMARQRDRRAGRCPLGRTAVRTSARRQRGAGRVAGPAVPMRRTRPSAGDVRGAATATGATTSRAVSPCG